MITNRLVVALDNNPFNAEVFLQNWVDLTPNVRSISISRGKSAIFSDFSAATVQIELNNNNREFDPTNTSIRTLNPQSAQWATSDTMAGRRRVRIGFGQFLAGVGLNPLTNLIFTGYTADWNLTFTPDGQGIATLTLYDFSGLLSEIFLESDIPDEELSGVRYKKIYDANRPQSVLSAFADSGLTLLGDQLIQERTSLADYLNLIARTEGGYAFNSRFGRQTFVQRVKSSGTDYLKLGLNGIPISGLAVSFGTELVYNRVRVQNIGDVEVVVEDADSQENNGIKEIDLIGMLGLGEEQSTNLANYYLLNYANAKLRFEQIEIAVSGLDGPSGLTADQEKLVRAEIGNYVEVSYKPNNVGNTITEFRRIIGIRHSIRPGAYYISFTLDSVAHNNFILNDELFGRLDVNELF